MKKIFIYLLSLLIGATFLISAYSKLAPIEPFEYNLVETTGVSWNIAMVLSRVIIALEFAIGVLFIVAWQVRKNALYSLYLIILFTVHLIVQISLNGNQGDCGCFGQLLPMTPLQGILKNIVLIIGLFILYKNPIVWKYNPSAAPYTIFLLSLVYVFTQNAVEFDYAEKFLNRPFENFTLNLDTIYNDKAHTNIGKPVKDIRNQKVVLCFLSSSCEHCKIAAKKIAIIHKQDNSIPFYFFINGYEKDIQKFIQTVGTKDIPYSKLNNPTFVQLVGFKLPVIYYYNSGTVEKQVDYYTLETAHLQEWLKP